MDKQKNDNGNSISRDELIFDFRTNMIIKKIRWFGLALGFVFFLINWIFNIVNHDGYIKFLELNFSPDGIISFPERVIIAILKGIIVMSIFWIVITSKSIIESLKPSIESLYKSSIFNRFLYFFVLVLFVLYYLVRGAYPYLYMEDGFFESLTVAFAIIASLLCLISIYYNSEYASIKLAFFVLFFLFGMEEISWGQRIFGWNTPEALSTINLQNETNIHNILNPYLQVLYPSFNLILAFLILKSMKLRIKVVAWLKIEKYLHFIPSHEFKLYGFIFILLSLQSYFHGGELTEEIFFVFILAYAVNLLGKKKTTK